jgi:hypothetical protein
MFGRRVRLPPAAIAFAIQGAAYLAVRQTAHFMEWTAAPLQFAFGCGMVAAMLSYFIGLARWWLPIQLLFVPALTAALSLKILPAYYLAAFLVLLAIYWSTFKSQVPLYLSSVKVWQALDSLLPAAVAGKSFEFIDLGSGMGGVLTHLAKIRPDGHFHGIESAPFLFIISWLRALRQKNCQLSWGSFWAEDLGKYDVVYAYLSPVPMARLWLKVQDEMRPGTLFVSSTFIIPDQSPERVIETEDLHASTLYIWRI